MHDECSGNLESGKQIVDKIRMMGFNKMSLPVAFEPNCKNCGYLFQIKMMDAVCPSCGMVYGVTPCHAHNVDFVRAAGVITDIIDTKNNIKKRMKELEALIMETEKRLPAHSVKPPIMIDLLEYDILMNQLKTLKNDE